MESESKKNKKSKKGSSKTKKRKRTETLNTEEKQFRNHKKETNSTRLQNKKRSIDEIDLDYVPETQISFHTDNNNNNNNDHNVNHEIDYSKNIGVNTNEETPPKKKRKSSSSSSRASKDKTKKKKKKRKKKKKKDEGFNDKPNSVDESENSSHFELYCSSNNTNTGKKEKEIENYEESDNFNNRFIEENDDDNNNDDNEEIEETNTLSCTYDLNEAPNVVNSEVHKETFFKPKTSRKQTPSISINQSSPIPISSDEDSSEEGDNEQTNLQPIIQVNSPHAFHLVQRRRSKRLKSFTKNQKIKRKMLKRRRLRKKLTRSVTENTVSIKPLYNDHHHYSSSAKQENNKSQTHEKDNNIQQNQVPIDLTDNSSPPYGLESSAEQLNQQNKSTLDSDLNQSQTAHNDSSNTSRKSMYTRKPPIIQKFTFTNGKGLIPCEDKGAPKREKRLNILQAYQSPSSSTSSMLQQQYQPQSQPQSQPQQYQQSQQGQPFQYLQQLRQQYQQPHPQQQQSNLSPISSIPPFPLHNSPIINNNQNPILSSPSPLSLSTILNPLPQTPSPIPFYYGPRNPNIFSTPNTNNSMFPPWMLHKSKKSGSQKNNNNNGDDDKRPGESKSNPCIVK